ncbi:hypothetical protein [Halobacillus litoralis]|uniref:hypothetical protein n=1 Tax=Halobacillus litoralis TaxID=45668 RepID=UPI001CFEC97C|nr:hypothetical protein [Halobacillus litoralis]
MDLLYWYFILSVVTATFFVIFKKVTRGTYWTIAVIAILYIGLLLYSFVLEFGS